MPYIFSTLSNDQHYSSWVNAGESGKMIEKQVLIKGGANVMNRHFLTPQGVPTQVSDEELQFLENNAMFKRHKGRGFITVESKKYDAEKVASGMKNRDLSSPLTPADYAGRGKAAPKTGSIEE